MAEYKTADILRAHKLKATQGRIAVLAILKSTCRPLSHDEILSRMKSARVNRVTVYRALDALVKAGLAHRAFVEGRSQVYESADHCGSRQCHPHFTCRGCSSVTCITGAEVPLVKSLPPGFVAHRQKVRIEGLCPSCAMRAAKRGERQ